MVLKSERIDRLLFLNLLGLNVVSLDELAINKKSLDKAILAIEQLSVSILHVKLPMAFVKTAILPVHFSISASKVIFVVSLVQMAADPRINPISLFLVIFELSFVFIAGACSFFPYSVSASHSVAEVPFVIAAVLPIVLSETVEFAL